MDIGIDLGTTFSTMGVSGRVALDPSYGEGRYVEDCDVTIIPGPYGEQTFPSVVIEDPINPGALLFGTDALQAADIEHAPIMFSKRKIGTSELLRTGSLSLTAAEVATHFLSFLRNCAEKALGETVERAVVTHPAYFDRIAVEQTREAAVAAGFDMGQTDQMLMEPVAAALAYIRTDKRDPLNVLTYDLGGGTFDVTVLQRLTGIIDMKAFDGDHLLGGYNFDRVLANWVRKMLETRGRTISFDMSTETGLAAVADLLRAAEKVKIDLANAKDDLQMIEFRERGVIKDVNGKDVPINERLSRKEFVQLIKPYLDSTVACCINVLKKANLKAEDINEVLLVGGSSYGPWIKEAVQSIFPNAVPRLFSPDLCVGIGAIIQASIILPKRINEEEFSLGLDAPERTMLEYVSISGEITAKNVKKLSGFRIRLLNDKGAELNKQALEEGNKFFFADVELMKIDEANKFTIQLIDGGNTVIHSHEFAVAHESKGGDISTITTVLPKPLFVETYDGLVPIAKEGVPLPARINCKFKRLNNNPNFDIALYQGGEIIGNIRIEDIPPQGGKGAQVELEVELTQKNEMRGKAIITSVDNTFKAERKISIKYNVSEVPGEDRLREEMEKLTQMADTLNAEAIIDQVKELLSHGERLLAQKPVETQEVYAVQRKVTALLQPPRDDMRPSRREIFELFAGCRTICQDMVNASNRIAGDEESGKGLDASMVQSAKRSIQRAGYHLSKLEALEQVSREAAERKDKRKWLQTYDQLKHIEAELRRDEEKQTAPTLIIKLAAKRDVIAILRKFFAEAKQIERNGQIKDWSAELNRIHRALIAALFAIDEVDDDLDNNEGEQAVRVIWLNQVQQLEDDVNKLGHVI